MDGDVSRAVQEQALRRQSVAACAAGLLVIGLDRSRQLSVDHRSNVGSVHAHAEGIGGDDHDLRVIPKMVVGSRTQIGVHSRMIAKRRPALGLCSSRTSSSTRFRDEQ